jgi:hypothetical protein
MTPRVLLDATTSPDNAAAERAFETVMSIKRIDVPAIEAASEGRSWMRKLTCSRKPEIA